MDNKNKKGFTLIELLVTIVIISLITLIGFVSVNSILKSSKERAKSISETSIKSIALSYVQENKVSSDYEKEENSENEYTCVTI